MKNSGLEDLGIYRTDIELLGRLSHEKWRAARLVIDTGIHSAGWTREQAIQFLQSQTGFTNARAEAEVDRYILIPAQALSYKLGETLIQSLRKEAQTKLGETFDLKHFYSQILGHGPIPLSLLESKLKTWIHNSSR